MLFSFLHQTTSFATTTKQRKTALLTSLKGGGGGTIITMHSADRRLDTVQVCVERFRRAERTSNEPI